MPHLEQSILKRPVMTAACASQDPDNLLTGEAQGYAAAQIFYDVFKVRSMSLIVNQVLLAESARRHCRHADLWQGCRAVGPVCA